MDGQVRSDLLPFAFARGQSVLAVAVRADLLAVSRDDFFVLRFLGHAVGVTTDTEWVDLVLREHRIRRGTVASRRPGLVGDMRITGAVTTGASYCRSGVRDGKLLL